MSLRLAVYDRHAANGNVKNAATTNALSNAYVL